jgi:tripartite-type tricarboxylate transporter receptor subunit TctC
MKRVAAFLVVALLSSAVYAQGFPTKPIRLVVPFAAGGATDFIARALGQKVSDSIGQQVVVDNRPGAAGAIGADIVAKAPPDGYTLLLATTSTHVILPITNPKLPYDPGKAFASIGLTATATNLLVASPTLPVATTAELIALGKTKPGQLAFASSGTGAITHLISEAFNARAGIKALHVPYKTGVQALPDLVSGRIAYQCDSIIWTLPQVKAGKIKGLGVTSAKRSTLAPELPTVAETLPGFEGVTWIALVGPAGIPAPVLSRLNVELNRAVQSADFMQKMAGQGAEAASGPNTPEQLNAMIRSDTEYWGKVIRDAGIRIE